MQPLLLQALRKRRSHMRQQWETLLRAAPVPTPLGNPDALVHLIDWTLDQIFATLGNPLIRQRTRSRVASHHTECACGRNPLVTYFAAGSQALREGLILAQVEITPLDPMERDAAFEEMNLVLQQISQREIEAFCGICQFRGEGMAASEAARFS